MSETTPMEARKVQIKFFIDSPKELDPDAFVPVFHRWIRDRVTDELLIDVTDYAHVPEAPAVLLVGHGSDYALDFAGGRAGLLYSRKREAPSDARECIVDAVRRALAACARLEEEKSFKEPLRFKADELLFRLNDRLLAPNTRETFAGVEPVLKGVLKDVYGADAALEHVGGPRELFSVRVRAPSAPGVGALLKRLV